MTTVADLVADTKRLAYGSMSDQLNFVDVDYVPGSGELFLTLDTAAITAGMVISSGLNVWYVTGVEASTKRALVYAGYQNSKDAVVAAGQPVFLRPRVTDWVVFQNVNDGIKAMSSRVNGLYKSTIETVTQDAGNWDIYPLVGTDVESIVAVRYREDWWNGEWKRLPDKMWRWEPSLNAIRLIDQRTRWWNDQSEVSAYAWGNSLEVTYRAPFTQATGLTQDVVTDLGLAASMVDIPPLKAAEMLVRTTETRRTQISAQGDPRRADEVQVGSNASAARELGKQFDKRCDDEYIRLVNVNPWMQSV